MIEENGIKELRTEADEKQHEYDANKLKWYSKQNGRKEKELRG